MKLSGVSGDERARNDNGEDCTSLVLRGEADCVRCKGDGFFRVVPWDGIRGDNLLLGIAVRPLLALPASEGGPLLDEKWAERRGDVIPDSEAIEFLSSGDR